MHRWRHHISPLLPLVANQVLGTFQIQLNLFSQPESPKSKLGFPHMLLKLTHPSWSKPLNWYALRELWNIKMYKNLILWNFQNYLNFSWCILKCQAIEPQDCWPQDKPCLTASQKEEIQLWAKSGPFLVCLKFVELANLSSKLSQIVLKEITFGRTIFRPR